MTYSELMAKLKTGGALTPEEVTELQKVSRPVDRFNEVTAERDTLKEAVKNLTDKTAALEVEKTNARQIVEDEFKTKLAALSGDNEVLKRDNEDLKKFKSDTEKMNVITNIANVDSVAHVGARFKDADYLALLLSKRGVDVTKPEDVKTALTAIKAEKPEQFVVVVDGGAGGDTSKNKSKTVQDGSDGKVEFKTPDERSAYIEKHGFEEYLKVAGEE